MTLNDRSEPILRDVEDAHYIYDILDISESVAETISPYRNKPALTSRVPFTM
jgi:hypothetical protein